jgi:hypothetical protein
MSIKQAIDFRNNQGELVYRAEADVLRFSAARCFPMTGEEKELAALRRLVAHLQRAGGQLAAFRQGPFLDFLLDHAPEAAAAIQVIVDPASQAGEHRGIPVVSSLSALPIEVSTIFIAHTLAEPTFRVRSQIPRWLKVFAPDIIADELPGDEPYGMIRSEASIYPMVLPELEVRPGLDLLLLDLPARAGQQISVGFSYVHSALKRSSLNFQSMDLDPIWYHRFQMSRLLDLGCEPVMANGVKVSAEAWGYNERIWVDPRQWPFIVAHFEEQIEELIAAIVGARPKIVAMSVHARNEWITRHLARRLKVILPETVILVGGHSCYSEPFGRGAFPEHDYMVIGEADSVVGPLAERLARGERPGNVPGVISVYDDPKRPFLPGPQPHNLDALGGVALDVWEDFNQIYQTYWGGRSTAIPLTRGCVWSRCSFCAERFAFRTRSPIQYVDEMEAIMATGRGGNFSASDSDFGGQPEVLHQLCEEIVRRNLKVTFGGQIRLNKNYDVDFFKLMKAAGMSYLNFGADAFTENTIRRQAKGYTIETLLKNHRDCAEAGIQPWINIVMGIPGETEQDVDDTIQLLSQNRDCFPLVNNINPCLLVQNSVYWFQPEKHNIHFYGDKEKLYKRYYFGIPSRLWYSTEPYIDRGVRVKRLSRMISGLTAAGIIVGSEAHTNLADAIAGGGHLDYREWLVDDDVSLSTWDIRDAGYKRPPPPAPRFGGSLLVKNGSMRLAFQSSVELRRQLDNMGVGYADLSANGAV